MKILRRIAKNFQKLLDKDKKVCYNAPRKRDDEGYAVSKSHFQRADGCCEVGRDGQCKLAFVAELLKFEG